MGVQPKASGGGGGSGSRSGPVPRFVLQLGCERDRLHLRAHAALQGSNAGRPPRFAASAGRQAGAISPTHTRRRNRHPPEGPAPVLAPYGRPCSLGFACEGLIDEDVLWVVAHKE